MARSIDEGRSRGPERMVLDTITNSAFPFLPMSNVVVGLVTTPVVVAIFGTSSNVTDNQSIMIISPTTISTQIKHTSTSPSTTPAGRRDTLTFRHLWFRLLLGPDAQHPDMGKPLTHSTLEIFVNTPSSPSPRTSPMNQSRYLRM